MQRPLFFSFKIGVPSAIGQALKLSTAAYLFSFVVVLLHHNQYKGKVAVGNFIVQQIIFYIGNFVVFLCWELIHHLHQVYLLIDPLSHKFLLWLHIVMYHVMYP